LTGRAKRFTSGANEGVLLRIEAVSLGADPPHEINVIVEVPVGGEPIKYEMDKKAGTLVVDRFLYTSMRYPGNYGFMPHTLSGDGDPLDVLIANQRGIFPGAIVAVRPIGVFRMQDEAGVDEKVIAVPVSRLTRRYDQILDYKQLPDITIKQIEHFFEHYKDLEELKWVKALGWGDVNEAKGVIMESIERAKSSPQE
jgi:inorganic pyrophosphatase